MTTSRRVARAPLETFPINARREIVAQRDLVAGERLNLADGIIERPLRRAATPRDGMNGDV